jgi:hypothetical protein
MFLVCSHLKKVRSIAYKCGTNKARPAGQLAQDVPVLFFLKKMTTKHSPEKKDIVPPTPKKILWSPIYTTPQKILANLEVLMKVARERFYVPPWI